MHDVFSNDFYHDSAPQICDSLQHFLLQSSVRLLSGKSHRFGERALLRNAGLTFCLRILIRFATSIQFYCTRLQPFSYKQDVQIDCNEIKSYTINKVTHAVGCVKKNLQFICKKANFQIFAQRFDPFWEILKKAAPANKRAQHFSFSGYGIALQSAKSAAASGDSPNRKRRLNHEGASVRKTSSSVRRGR